MGKVGSEHSSWAAEVFPSGPSDPHSRAYQVLFNPVSVEMAKKLNLGEAHRAERCLKCHAVLTHEEPDVRAAILAEGVGCSACHGPAEKWLSVHYLPEWQTLSSRDKWLKYGFIPTKNLVARTLNCASCHMGDSSRDVNHDLYAAGHPRITFEAARLHYHPDYRHHWTEKTPQPDFEIRLWIVGQAAALRAATDLLRARAERALAHTPESAWPEFAGYSCYACHQRVGEGAVRNSVSAMPRPLGVAGWEVLANTGVAIAAQYCSTAYPGLTPPTLTEVQRLRKLMDGPRPPSPATVRQQATKALGELDAWLAELQTAEDGKRQPVPSGTTEQLLHALANNALTRSAGGETLLADHDWDALTANYLGCAAMYHARGGRMPSWQKPLDSLREQLRFPALTSGQWNSPADFTVQKLNTLRENFILLRNMSAPSATPEGGKK
ncbi:MAG: cytochrome c family protein [Gemmata sp.]|nr:cytochrome c family protein [Gemmata sp.]